MSDGNVQQHDDATTLVRAYREAFDRRDLDACVGYFDEDATIRFLFSTYQGRDAIEQCLEPDLARESWNLHAQRARVPRDSRVERLGGVRAPRLHHGEVRVRHRE